MRIVEHAAAPTSVEGDWADHTRRVLTRDLLLRADGAHPAEGRALQFRALHLNLPLVGEVTDRLGLDAEDRVAVEHHALDALAEALHAFDASGDEDFADFAEPFVEGAVRRALPVGATTV